MAAPSTCTTKVAVDLFYRNVVKYFDLPEDIVSDRDSFHWSVLHNFVWVAGFTVKVFYC